VTQPSPASLPSRHLYIVAGYPASGKTSALWKAARDRQPLFGPDHLAVIPERRAIQFVSETSDTNAKLRAGFWCALRDLPQMNREARLPDRLILHLDLVQAVVIHGDRAMRRRPRKSTRHFGVFSPSRRCARTTVVPLRPYVRRWPRFSGAGATAILSASLAPRNRTWGRRTG
jgi:hypothetical protein